MASGPLQTRRRRTAHHSHSPSCIAHAWPPLNLIVRMKTLVKVLLGASLGAALFWLLSEVLRPKQEAPHRPPREGIDALTGQQQEALLQELSQQL